MTEHKFTDEEIIKALECCMRGNHCEGYCPYDDEYDDFEECTSKLTKDALDLINRQKAELEDLREIVFTDRTEAIKKLKSEAIKEFAERLKEHYVKPEFPWDDFYVDEGVVDNLVKEMTGETI